MDSWLEAYRYVNGTECLVERMKIRDTVNSVPLLLTYNRVYRLQVRFEDGTTYSFGTFISGVDPTPTLSITQISFSRQAQLTYRYVTVEASRSSDGSTITVNYWDKLAQTNWVNFTITYLNGSIAYTDSVKDINIVQFLWNEANNETDYVVIVDIDHQFFGTSLRYVETLSGLESYPNAPSLGVLGSWGFMNSNDVFATIIILIFAGAFSAYNIGLGLFIAALTAGLFTYLGWLSIPTQLLAIVFALVFLIGIVISSRRGGG